MISQISRSAGNLGSRSLSRATKREKRDAGKQRTKQRADAMPGLVDLTGRRFGRLIVIRRVNNGKSKNRRWLCLCDCGNEKIIYGSSLPSGRTKSCGCLQKELVRKRFTKHGHSKNKLRTYNIWKSMNQRCVNPRNKEYHNYGGRGIRVCQRWKQSFAHFLEDIGDPPTDRHQIDRIDNDQGYCQNNCRWVTPKQQQRHRRNNHLITHGGRTQILVEWAEETGLKRGTIAARLKKGWSAESALTIPVKRNRKL